MIQCLPVDQSVVAFNAFAKVGLVVFFLVQGSTGFTSGHPVGRRRKGFCYREGKRQSSQIQSETILCDFVP